MTRPVRLAMLGAGWWATTAHLPAMAANPEIELVAVCDPDPARAKIAADRFGVAAAFTEVYRLLDEVTLDGVVVATPHHTHHLIVQAALQRGLHTLVEKPMMLRGDHAWELVELARSRGCHLSVGLTYQYAPAASRIRRAVQQQIGDLVCVNADFPSATAKLFARTDPAQDDLDHPERPHGTTFSDPATGGGQAYTQLTHLLGALLWAVHDQATDVSAFTEQRGMAVDVVDALAFRLSSGALGVATSTGTTADGVQPRQPIRFHGTEGMVEWNLADSTGVVRARGGRVEELCGDGPAYRSEEVTAAFGRLISGDGPNLGPADDAAAGVALIDAAHRAARSGRQVAVLKGRLSVQSATPRY